MLTQSRLRRLILAVLLATALLSGGSLFARGRGGGGGGFGGGRGGGGFGNPGGQFNYGGQSRNAPARNNWSRNLPANSAQRNLPPQNRSFNNNDNTRNYNGFRAPYQNRPTYTNGYPANYYSRPTTPVVSPSARAAQPSPTPPKATPQPTVASRTPSPLETLAEQLYDQTRLTAWDMYRHYRDSPGYADAYRELHRLMKTLKSVAAGADRLKTGEAAPGKVADGLREAEVMLHLVQLQATGWSRDADAAAPGKRGDLGHTTPADHRVAHQVDD